MALLAALIGALLVVGVVMVVLYFRPAPPKRTKRRSGPTLTQRWAEIPRRTKTLIVIGVSAGILGGLISGILLLVVVIPAAVVGLPLLLGKQDTREKDLIIALEAWARSLASTADTGTFTLREVIGVTRGSAQPVLRVGIDRLYLRMSGSWPTADALREFAEEMNSAYVDEVVIYLVQAAEFSGGGLTKALSGVADTLAGQAKLRMEIFNEREKPRRTMQVMTGIVAVVLTGIVAFSHTSQIAYYSTPAGEVVLAAILALFAGILVWAKTQTRTKPEPRIVLNQEAEVA